MRRVEPAFPDLLPVTHRLGGPPACRHQVVLDLVEMRLRWRGCGGPAVRRDTSVPRKPVRVLVHAALAREEARRVEELIAAGCGLLVSLDDELSPEALPVPPLAGQIVVVAPSLPPAWGGPPAQSLAPFVHRGLEAGVLLALAPTPGGSEEVHRRVAESVDAGAQFVAAAPLALPPADRHRLYDALSGEDGDGELENLLFHSDLAALLEALERETSRAAAAAGVDEFIPAPATATSPRGAARGASQLLLWARRLDVLDGIDSAGWQLRRAARALLAAGKDPMVLAAEDNLRIVPGFDPWVEAFARSLWQGGGEPFDGVRERWMAA